MTAPLCVSVSVLDATLAVCARVIWYLDFFDILVSLSRTLSSYPVIFGLKFDHEFS
jgi:hypothetical protein